MGANESRIRPGDRGLVVRATVGGAVILGLVALGMLLPHPGAATIRAWADSTGPWFLALFFVAHAVVTIFPIPRTMFTVSAGFLFGPVVGIAVCMAASTVAASVAFLGVREIDRRHPSRVIARAREHRAYAPIAARLRARGWLAVGSLRLIAAAPFSLVNYASALSPVPFWPYFGATVAGLAPGTIAVVLLGDALTGESSPWLVVISGVLMATGIAGLLLDARMPASREA
ncbi:TVP38/TMEM64 family protein [Tsukamurella paurometabola]|uniref:TVP38/TMEM64 family membrane protein n=1 Tax=Tsukamurella paurometabola TaxID=2061 RepID=A0ABS5N6V5_TSUPA|nr:TVP38/TMEM64 family protein [Tsukamurella paurometabola]MBS4099672.1 TVP38/TMEM64 family protein [Tsukamurella paurometabola]